MTGEVNFSGKLSKKVDINEIKGSEIRDTAKAELDKIFDIDNNKELSIDELVKSVADIDTDKDGKISDAEMQAAYNKLSDAQKQNINQTEYITYLKAMSAKNAELAQGDNIGNGYTVQLGEQLADLVARVLKSQGVDNPSDEQKENCRQMIINNNPQAIAKDGNGNYKWLVAGTRIYLPTDTTDSAKVYVKDQNNHDEVVNKYKSWQRGDISNFTYSIDDSGQRYEVRGDEKKAYGEKVQGADIEAEDDATVTSTVNLKHYETEGVELGMRLFNQVKGLSKAENTRKILKEINKENVYAVVNTFNSESPNENIIKYLVNEKNITFEDLNNIFRNVLAIAEEFGLKDTEEYKDVKYDYDKCLNNTVDPNKKNRDWADHADAAIKALLQKVKELADKQTEPKQDSVKADYKIRDSKREGVEIGDELYSSVKGISDFSETDEVINKINKNNVYYVIDEFNKKSPEMHIIEYMVNEYYERYGDINKILNKVLELAADYGLSNQKEYYDVKAYKNYCDSNYYTDPTDKEWGRRVDKVVSNLMAKIKEAAKSREEDL